MSTYMPDHVRSYVGRIRNAQKRNYAYAWYLLGCVREPSRNIGPGDGELSYMAAQSVRLELHGMMPQRDTGDDE